MSNKYGKEEKEIIAKYGIAQSHSSLLLIPFLVLDTNKGVVIPHVSSER